MRNGCLGVFPGTDFVFPHEEKRHSDPSFIITPLSGSQGFLHGNFPVIATVIGSENDKSILKKLSLFELGD